MSGFNNPQAFNEIAQGILTQLYSSLHQPEVPTLKSQITEYYIPPFERKPRVEMSNGFVKNTMEIPKSQEYLNLETPKIKLNKTAIF